ncbi:MAG: TatD family hydrolase, partial [Sphingomonadaceae bacterium]|nr:TatD family hydrolase [Sphingomonadaceae bacterium]
MLIDSHCHLQYKGLVEDQQGVLARAREAGIGGFLNISTRQSEWDSVIATAAREDDVWASIGIHPHEADKHADLGEQALIDAAAHPKVIGIGETGLDYYYEHSDRMTQQALFRTHISASRATGLPVIIHTRDADEDTARIVSEE